MKKGQSSVELLILLTSIIVILLVIIGITSYVPQIGKNIQENQYRMYWANSDIGILAHHFNSTHGYFRLKNNLDVPIRLKNLSLDGSLVHSSDALINPAEKYDYTFPYILDNPTYELTVEFGYLHLVDQSIYYFQGEAPLNGVQSLVTGNIEDSFAPGAVSGLSSPSQTNSSIYWNWTNPTDSDFYQTMIYINDINVVNTSNEYYNATGLVSNTPYIIKIHTKDLIGNVNWTIVDDLNFTLSPFLIFFKSPTPENGTYQNKTSIFVNVSSAHPENNISTFINFDNSLISWWRMDDLDGNAVIDYMGRNNGTNFGATQVAGKMGSAMSFSGNRIDLGNLTSLTKDKVTLSAWFYAHTTQTSTSFNPILTQYNINDNGYYLYLYGNKPSLYLGCTTYLEVVSTESISINTWHHILGVNTGDILKIYVDGVLKGQSSSSCSGVDAPAYIGHDAVYNSKFNGSIDDVLIFNRSLSEEEIQALYANTSSKYLGINFTNLADGNHSFKAYAQDTYGNVIETETRKITITS